ncbi:MAG: hypothetical protein QG594_1589 [Bacteroidota bacterium]|nr:hypothetical protein [Bacteroidota bacterium]
MKKLGIVITDGVGFRNFIMSDFISNAVLEFEKVSIYSGLPQNCYFDLIKALKSYIYGLVLPI